MSASMDYLDFEYSLRSDVLFTPKHLLHVADRRTTAPLLSFAVRAGLVRRVGPGIYLKAVRSAYREIRPLDPDPAIVARLHVESGGEVVQTHGADAARAFGIDAPVGEGPRFYYSGRTRTVRIGEVDVRFTGVPGIVLGFPGTRAGLALAALHHVRREPEGAVRAIRAGLDEADRERVRSVLGRLPGRVVRTWCVLEPWTRVPLPPPLPEAPWASTPRRRPRRTAFFDE